MQQASPPERLPSPQAASPTGKAWFAHAFDRAWLDLYPHRNDDEARRNAPVIARLLGLRVGDGVLDVSCGAGRYARALAARGMRVTGVDLSRDLLQEARRRGGDLPGSPDYFRGDARRLPFAGQFRGAISVFTSFGYFEDRADDVAIFTGVRRALVPRGRFLLDFLNESQVRASLVPQETKVHGSTRLSIHRRIADGPGGPCVFKRVDATNLRGDTPISSFEERVRLYTDAEVVGLLEEAGLRPVGEALGDLQGAPYMPDAPRLVRVAEKR